ncbi:S-layer homology domain-containing protein [Paenibacillus sp. DXFW5]|uniref:Alpha-galactosidase n=2 Tax=Paenibacillus rhizolycopersici TaxID=2780073 RepID=A0ABS2H6D7_9BACL|nr:S-layer homology domain-containing protein [Paenibacillus rhizolycopersici]
MMIRLLQKTLICLLAAAIVLVPCAYFEPSHKVAHAADNGLAMKPYMGWSSYSLQVYDGPEGNWTSEEKLKKISDAMHEKLQSHGYEYINIDAGWNGSMDEYGRPIPSETLYPNGFVNLVDYIHNNGQKVGIYLIPGLSKEAYRLNLPIYGTEYHMQDIAAQPLRQADYWDIDYKIDFSKPGAQEYINSIADLIASWGVDFVKFDSVTPGSGHNDLTIDARDDVKAWSTALSKHGIWFELSWALDHNYVDFWKKYANGWRVNWDVEAYDPNVGMTQWANIARLFPDAALWWRDAGPGGWNDFDSLNVGNGQTSGLTRDERQTATTLWAIASAQFYTGDDLTNLDSYGLELLTNDEVIAVNQAGRPAHPVSMATNQQVWVANNGDGTYTVALFNLGNKGASMDVKWSDIGLDGAASVRDLWSHAELGQFATGMDNIALEPHASRLFKVTAKNGTSKVNDDDTGVKYTGNWTRNGGNELVQDVQDLNVTIVDSSAAASGNAVVYDAAAVNEERVAEPAGQEAPGSIAAEAGEHWVIYNDNHPSVTYDTYGSNGSWGYSSGRDPVWNDYLGDVHYGEKGEVRFEHQFKGTGVDFLTETAESGGDIDIDLDGEFQETVSANAPNQQGQIPVYSVRNLPFGEHTISGVMKGGTYLLVDGFKVYADSLLGATTASFDTTNPQDIPVSLPLGGDTFTHIANGSAELVRNTDYAVSGDSVTIKKAYLAQQPPGPLALTFGFAGGDTQTFTVDITGPVIVNSTIAPKTAEFDQKASAQADVSTTMTLNGNTLVRITNGAEALSEGADFSFEGDTIRIHSSYLAAQPTGITELTFQFSAGLPQTLMIDIVNTSGRFLMINNNDPGIRYTGSWNRSTGRNFGDYQDDVHFAETNGDFLEYTFKGTGIQYITEIDPSQGEVDVYLDGAFAGTVDTHADARQPMQAVYSISGLTDSLHTIKLVKKSGRFMLLDALKVQIPDLINHTEATFDKNPSAQDDIEVEVLGGIGNLGSIRNGQVPLVAGADYTVTGNIVTIKKEYLAVQPLGSLKLTFHIKGDYYDDVHATEVNGDSFEYTFKGTGIDLHMPKGPAQGEMEVYIDGQLKSTVDAYNESRSAQQPLFGIANLPAGQHTVKVVKKSGELMLADLLIYRVAPGSTTPTTPTNPSNPPSSPTGPSGPSAPPSAAGTEIVRNPANQIPVDIIRTTLADGTKRDEVKLTADAPLRAAIDKLEDEGVTSLTLTIPDAKDEVASVQLSLARDFIQLITGRGLELKLQSTSGEILFPAASLQGSTGDLTVTIHPVKAANQSKEIEGRANKAEVVLASTGGQGVTVIGRPVQIETNLQNREVELILPLAGSALNDADPAKLGVYIEHSDGTTEFLTGEVVPFGNGKGLKFSVDHFSTFVLVKTAEAMLPTHKAYISGYPGGLFKPENRITRAEMAAMLSKAVGLKETAEALGFNDVPAGYWAAEAIAQASRMGLMQGFADGSFKPEQPVTRAEITAVAAKFMKSVAGQGTGFSDTAGHWAEEAIRSAQAAGIVSGYADGKFRPAAFVTRAEAVTVINRALGRGPLFGNIDVLPVWRDVPQAHWAFHEIAEASTEHVATPRAGGGEEPSK